MKFHYPPGATPINQDEIEGLLLPIHTQEELNFAEKRAILECIPWAKSNSKLREELLTISGLKLLHQKMFSPVWSWAGERRKSEKNIGVPPHQLEVKLQELCDNSQFRISRISDYEWPNFAAHFHHALVFIHFFVNGNGRHARLATELLALKLNHQVPFWGSDDLDDPSLMRTEYIKSLKEADKGEFEALVGFMFGR